MRTKARLALEVVVNGKRRTLAVLRGKGVVQAWIVAERLDVPDRVTLQLTALDTTDPEPLPDPHPLRGRENVIITPHVAWYSEQSLVGLQAGAPSEVRRVLTGEWPLNVVNRAVKGKNRAGL